jgi:hypothetical protein
MKKIFIFVLLVNLCIQLIVSQNKLRKVPLDSIFDIAIEKLIYYQDPIALKKGEFSEMEFKPVWYQADRGTSNSEGITPEVSMKFYQKRMEITREQIARSINDTVQKKEKNKYYQKWPVDYKFGEVWFTIKSTGEKIVLVLNTIKQNDLGNVRFKDPSKKNSEAIDSLGIYSSPIAYIFEDGIWKYGDQMYILEKLKKNAYRADYTLKGFKDVLFRAPMYIRSLKNSGKRVFETVENTANGAVAQLK